MIFLTVGTHEPFDRLVQAVDGWCAAVADPPEIFGQITARAGYQPQHFQAVDVLAPEVYTSRFNEAQAIISHAGMGSIITAFSLQKPIVVMPRRGRLNETRNDHQFATIKRFAARPGILVAEDETQLPQAMNRLQALQTGQGTQISPFAEPRLINALRHFIDTGVVG